MNAPICDADEACQDEEGECCTDHMWHISQINRVSQGVSVIRKSAHDLCVVCGALPKQDPLICHLLSYFESGVNDDFPRELRTVEKRWK